MRKTLKQLAKEAEYHVNISILLVGTRAAYFADEVKQAFWLTRADLEYAEICAKLYGEENYRDAYSHWCNNTGTPMATSTRRKLFGS